MSIAGTMKQAPPRDEPGPSGAHVAEVDRHLGGVRARDQVRHPEQVEEALVGHPATAAHDLVAHERDVRRRPAERDQPELEEEPENLPDGARSTGERAGDRVDVVHAAAPGAAARLLQRGPDARVVGQLGVGGEVGPRRRAASTRAPSAPRTGASPSPTEVRRCPRAGCDR
jgi:hypothetical protein